jgi:hypothetical protein
VEHQSGTEASLVEICDYIPCPCEHCQEHEQKIKDRRRIYKRKQFRDIMVLVKESPYHIDENITDRGKNKAVKAYRHTPLLILLLFAESVLFDRFQV